MDAVNDRNHEAWTERQRQVLDLLVAGRTNGEIAEILGISLDGVKWHVSQILLKLDVGSREDAAEYWRNYNGLPRRFSRVFKGLAAGGALRWAGLVAASVAFTGAIALAVSLIMTSEPRSGNERPDAGETEIAAAPTTQADVTAAPTRIETLRAEALAHPDPQAGTCLGASIAAPPREDAFRCLLGNRIYDPCFSLGGGLVGCDVDPEAGAAAIAIAMNSDLPRIERSSQWTAPAGWLVFLVDGALCQPATGATGSVAGKLATYRCDDGRWILGELEQEEVWLAMALDPTLPDAPREVQVAVIWR